MAYRVVLVAGGEWLSMCRSCFTSLIDRVTERRGTAAAQILIRTNRVLP